MAQPEPPSLGHVQRLVQQRHGMLDLLDIFVEADRLNGFTQFFNHSGTKEVRSREALRPLLLLDLFAEGTNTGIKRVAKANQHYAYDELLYVRKHYLSVEALRQANAAVVNKILAIRNPLLWGEGYACASDGKGFESWSQNLMTEWRSRYRGYGVLVYWHVEYGRQGIFATNSREHQAITTLCLQLLQNCMMLINTILVQQADEQHQFLEQLSAEDRRALTPLFYEHVNPYGLFALHLERPPLLEAA